MRAFLVAHKVAVIRTARFLHALPYFGAAWFWGWVSIWVWGARRFRRTSAGGCGSAPLRFSRGATGGGNRGKPGVPSVPTGL